MSLGDPALGLPALDFGDETPVAGGEVLGSQIRLPASLRLLDMRPPLPRLLSKRWTICPASRSAWAAESPAMPVPMIAMGTVIGASFTLLYRLRRRQNLYNIVFGIAFGAIGCAGCLSLKCSLPD